ncbi:MAG TPA: AraC family transcriptional regulator [Chitinophagaceae bacterium]
MFNLFYGNRGGAETDKAFTRFMIGDCVDGKVCIAEETGTGTLETITFDEGLIVKICDCNLNQQVALNCRPPAGNTSLLFSLIYCLTPEAFLLQNSMGKNTRMGNLWNTVFSCSRADFKFTISPHIPARFVSISFTKEWIEKETASMHGETRDFICGIIHNNTPGFYIESYTAIEKKMIFDIFDNKKLKQSGSLFLKSRAVTLIHEFINKSTQGQLLRPILNRYESVIHQVAAELVNSLYDSLPNLKVISRKFALSESTLKRNFKIIYGKNISEYYMELKMAQAKVRVSACNETITETAYVLGYEKVSHFIALFKKHNGCLPGALQKSLFRQIN